MVNIGEGQNCNRQIARLAFDNQRIGQLAAEHLTGLGLKNLVYHGVQGRWYSDEWLRGFTPTTDVLHADDPSVKRAIQSMKQNYSKPFTMDAVAEAVGVSRRLLAMRFRAERKTSPAVFLANLRLQKTKVMFADRACGYGTGKNLCGAFRRIFNASQNNFTPDSVSH